MREFFDLWERAIQIDRMLTFECGWSTVADWCLSVRSRKKIGEEGNLIFSTSSHCKESLFAASFLNLEEYLLETNGGY